MPTGPRPTPTEPGRSLVAVVAAVVVAIVVALVIAGRADDPSGNRVEDATASTRDPERPGVPCPDIGAWTPRDRLAQLLMVGVDPAGTAEAAQVVRDEHVGGIFIGGTATGLITSGTLPGLRGLDGVRPFVAVDDEGGRVQRIDALVGDLPSARRLAATASVDEIERAAEQRGDQLLGYGITVDFAPVLDISAQPDGGVIGDRSFSRDPTRAARDARAFAAGLSRAGVLPVYKHFPGHGRADGDSHRGRAITPPIGRLGPDLAPYRRLLPDAPMAAVMVGHLQVPGLTKGRPASISGPAIAGLLRKDLRFDGLVFTDDLSGMRAITDRVSTPDAVRLAIDAGADVALLAEVPDIDDLLDRLEADLTSGTLDRHRVSASLRRVLVAKGYDCR